MKDCGDECNVQRAGVISDFIQLREVHSEQAVNEIIEYLCTY